MRSGTCRMLKFSTNADVPFLIYAVISWLRLIKRKAKYEALKKELKKGRDGNK